MGRRLRAKGGEKIRAKQSPRSHGTPSHRSRTRRGQSMKRQTKIGRRALDYTVRSPRRLCGRSTGSAKRCVADWRCSGRRHLGHCGYRRLPRRGSTSGSRLRRKRAAFSQRAAGGALPLARAFGPIGAALSKASRGAAKTKRKRRKGRAEWEAVLRCTRLECKAAKVLRRPV